VILITGILAAQPTENAVASVAVGARQRILRLPPPSSSSSSSSSSYRENGLLDAAVALMDSTWSTVSLWMASSSDHHLEWLSSVTREKGICLMNATARCETRRQLIHNIPPIFLHGHAESVYSIALLKVKKHSLCYFTLMEGRTASN